MLIGSLAMLLMGLAVLALRPALDDLEGPLHRRLPLDRVEAAAERLFAFFGIGGLELWGAVGAGLLGAGLVAGGAELALHGAGLMAPWWLTLDILASALALALAGLRLAACRREPGVSETSAAGCTGTRRGR